MRVQFSFVSEPTNKRKLIKWDNPIAIQDGYSVWSRMVDGRLTGQFCMCPVYLTDAQGNWIGGWSANSSATTISHDEMLKISDLQKVDNFTIYQKMEWLMNGGTGEWGSPMKATWNQQSETWKDAKDIKMIAAVYAGQWVQVIVKKNIKVTFNGSTSIIPMSQIKTFSPSEWNQPLASQLVTEVDRDNIPGENPKGVVRMPIYFGNRIAWIFDRWLE
jgi:hypothetical protein